MGLRTPVPITPGGSLPETQGVPETRFLGRKCRVRERSVPTPPAVSVVYLSHTQNSLMGMSPIILLICKSYPIFILILLVRCVSETFPLPLLSHPSQQGLKRIWSYIHRSHIHGSTPHHPSEQGLKQNVQALVAVPVLNASAHYSLQQGLKRQVSVRNRKLGKESPGGEKRIQMSCWT